MSSKTTELCLLLVEETYGELSAVLMTHGRQQIPGIVRYAGLTPLQIKHGLAVLVQQHLALWSSGTAAFYEAHWPAAYALVRSGKFSKAARDRFDSNAELVLTRCMLDGDSKANDLEHAFDVLQDDDSNSANGHGINGGSSTPTENSKSLTSSIYDLLDNGLVVLSNTSHFRAPIENLAKVDRHIRVQKPEWAKKIKPSDKPVFQRNIEETLAKWKYGSGEVKNAIQQRRLDAPLNLKREFQTLEEVDEENHQRPQKKQKTLKPTINGNGIGSFDSEIMVRPNYDKYPVLVRSRRLIQLAADRIGSTTSRVYATVLYLLDKDIMQCDEFKRDAETPLMDDKSEQPRIETRRIIEAIGNLEDLRTAIGTPHKSDREPSANESPISVKQSPRKKHRRLSDAEGDQVSRIDSDSGSDIVKRTRLKPNGKAKVQEPSTPTTNGKGKGKAKTNIIYDDDSDVIISDEEEDDSAALGFVALRQHLHILVDHNLLDHHSPVGEKGSKERWSIPFSRLSHGLRLTEINISISAQFGTSALRIARILQKHGKLDEKTLISHALIDTKLLRSTLASLHSAGYIELQELPRDNNRAPSKTLYLWYFDAERCGKKMIEDHYHAMSRCLQRLRYEREQVRELLEKSQRSDVKGREREFLVGEEWKSLERWREVEERLLGEVSRLDDGVVVLRDL